MPSKVKTSEHISLQMYSKNNAQQTQNNCFVLYDFNDKMGPTESG